MRKAHRSLILPYGLDYSGAKVLPSTPEYPYLRIDLGGRVIATNLVGAYNADNVMAALAVGEYFGVSREEAVKAVEAYVPSNNRSQMVRTERNTLIVDAYNANPTSMAAALSNFANVQSDSKVAMLGDMLELGEDSVAEHVKVVGLAVETGLSEVCFVGSEFEKALKEVGHPAGYRSFPTSLELADYLKAAPVSDSVVLIKGSRGTRMEKVIETL